MQVSGEVAEMIDTVFLLAGNARFEYVTPELILYVACQNKGFAGGCSCSAQLSQGTARMLSYAWESAKNSGRTKVELPHMVHAMYDLEESYAVYYMRLQGVDQADLLQEMLLIGEKNESSSKRFTRIEESVETEEQDGSDTQGAFWQQYAVCLNDSLEGTHPLIGREDELERTMQILCRKEKNNPLHLGEPGVGKTAIVYGLAKLLEEGKVVQPLLGAKIFSLDLGSLLAGTQYRGDFEKRLKKTLDSISREEKPIIYMDEIHNIVGAGAVNGTSFDISNMLKPYLSAGHIRFIGATTFEEYKKHFEKSKSLVRRFQNVEIKEPDFQDAVHILEGLKETYEAFHGVVYEEGVLEYAVSMSDKYIQERFLRIRRLTLWMRLARFGGCIR